MTNRTRRCDHKTRHLLITLAAMLAGAVSTSSQAEPTGRNILFIAVDDLRNWVNYGGNYAGTVHTPNIDALAAQSTRYLNAYTAVPQCVGSRTTVMLGLSPATHGIDRPSWGTGDPAYEAVYGNPAIVSLPEVLSDNGYYTAMSGKVFNSPLPDRWDESGPATLIEQLYNGFDPGPDNTFLHAWVTPETEVHPDQIVANWSSDFIANYAGTEPFFLAVGFYLPHLPWGAPQWAYDLYPPEDVVTHTPTAGDLDDEPPQAVAIADAPIFFMLPQYELVEISGQAAAYTRAYLASISHTDAMVGQVLTALANSPHAGNTDIILWSDHGYHLGEKFHWRKNALWDPAVRVPLLVSSPGNASYPVQDVTDPVSLVDLAPTVLDLAGLPPFDQFDGVPLSDAENRPPVFVYYKGGRAQLVNGWKIIDYKVNAPPGIEDMAAYWVDVDKNETTNAILPLITAILRCQAQGTC